MSPLLDVGAGQVREIAQFYQIVELIGTGRFSEVYRAFDTATQTDVAFKVYVQADEQAHLLMHAERDVLSLLGTLNTEYFPRSRKGIKTRIKNRNHPVLIMELGQYVAEDSARSVISLRDVIPDRNGASVRRLPFDWSWAFATSFITEILRALRLVHGQGLIHRDLKPSNVLVKRPAGTAAVVPFLIDFNSSTSADSPLASSATPQYLPPEVRSSQRSEPTIADDLWAVAVIAWEVVHGTGADMRSGVPPHAHLSVTPGTPALQSTLLKALAVDPATRYQTADDFLGALSVALGPSPAQVQGCVSAEIFAEARRLVPEVRQRILELLAGQDEIVVSKEVREQVATLFAWFSEDHTQPFDLSADVVALGPSAIPAALEEGYKLTPSSPSFEPLVRALARVARPHRAYAERAIVHYSLSSNFGTRSLARALCAELEIFPSLLLDLLVVDDGLLIPSERVALADLCIQHCDRPSSVLALVKYMCREYVLDGNRYQELRDRIATRMGQLQFDQTSRLLVQDAERHIWEEIEEFERLPAGRRREVEVGLMQLMGDAFASQGEQALDLFKRGQVPRFSTGSNRLRVFGTFGRKLARRFPPAAEWFQAEATRRPEDPDFMGVVQYLGESPRPPAEADLPALLERYIEGDNQAFNSLCFCRDTQLFPSLEEVLTARPSAAGAVVRLLRGFHGRWRILVVRFALSHWKMLADADYESAVDVLSLHAIRDGALRGEAIGTLERDLQGSQKAFARRGIDLLLVHQ